MMTKKHENRKDLDNCWINTRQSKNSFELSTKHTLRGSCNLHMLTLITLTTVTRIKVLILQVC